MTEASVTVEGTVIARIEKGLLVLLCAEKDDTETEADSLLTKLLSYRVFADQAGKMNLNLSQADGALLLVPQFTLAADTRSGTRPSFTPAAAPDRAKSLFDYFAGRAKASHPVVQTGRFGADMQVSLVNNGPVTFWLQVKPVAQAAVT